MRPEMFSCGLTLIKNEPPMDGFTLCVGMDSEKPGEVDVSLRKIQKVNCATQVMTVICEGIFKASASPCLILVKPTTDETAEKMFFLYGDLTFYDPVTEEPTKFDEKVGIEISLPASQGDDLIRVINRLVDEKRMPSLEFMKKTWNAMVEEENKKGGSSTTPENDSLITLHIRIMLEKIPSPSQIRISKTLVFVMDMDANAGHSNCGYEAPGTVQFPCG